jgi:hypothetical protein
MSPVGFEPKILAGERPHIYALDRAATGTGVRLYHISPNYLINGMSFEKKKLFNPKCVILSTSFV